MPIASRIPPSLFNLDAFRMFHIAQSIPSLDDYHPSTSYPTHNSVAQMGYKNFGVPQHSGGYYPHQNFNNGNFNIPGGNTMGVGYNVQHNTPNWLTKVLPGIPLLATLNIPDLTKLTTDLVSHLPQWPPIPTKLP